MRSYLGCGKEYRSLASLEQRYCLTDSVEYLLRGAWINRKITAGFLVLNRVDDCILDRFCKGDQGNGVVNCQIMADGTGEGMPDIFSKNIRVIVAPAQSAMVSRIVRRSRMEIPSRRRFCKIRMMVPNETTVGTISSTSFG